MKTNFTVIFILLAYLLSAQTVFLEENFNNCELPGGWSFQQETDSEGWKILTAAELNSEKQTFPSNNGNCFAGSNDSRWDDDQGSNNAVNDQIITPFLDLEGAEDIVLSFDYLSGHGNGITIFYRTEETEDWNSIYNTFLLGGMLDWQEKTVHVYGHNNEPISSLEKPIQFMFKYSDFGFSQRLGVGLDNVKIYEPVSNDIVLADVIIPDVVPVGIIPVKTAFLNEGTNAIQSVVIKWQLDDGPIVEQTFDKFLISSGFEINSLIPHGTGTLTSGDIMVNFLEEGNYLLKVWVELAEGIIDDIETNNFFQKTISVRNSLPEKEYIYEKFSHHTCGPCYDADLLSTQISEDNENIHIVSIHQADNDPMDYPEARELDIAYSQRTHPGTIMDRRFMGQWEHGKMASLYEQLPILTSPWWSPVDVYFTNKVVDEVSRTVELEIAAKFVVDLSSEYRFNIWTIEDGIVAYQTSAPEGNNYVHNHVLRNYAGGNYGQEGSIPEQIISGEEYTYETTVNIDETWNMDKLTFIAVIQRFEEDSDRREIVNASVIHISDQVIVSQIELEEIDLKVYPNPTSDFLHVVLPAPNQKVAYAIYNDLGQQLSQRNLGVHGQNYLQLDLRHFSSGNYLLMVEIGDKKVIENFVVKK